MSASVLADVVGFQMGQISFSLFEKLFQTMQTCCTQSLKWSTGEILKTKDPASYIYIHVSDHCWAGGESHQSADQSLHLLDQDLRRVDEDGLQAGQSGELDALVGTGQGLQKQRQELNTNDDGGTIQ